MGKRATFTDAELTRAMKVARKFDPAAIVEVTKDGTIRILPAASREDATSDVDRWFSGQS